MSDMFDYIGFGKMSALDRARYLLHDYRTKISLEPEMPVNGIEIVQIFESQAVPLDGDGFVNYAGLLEFVYKELNVSKGLRDMGIARAEEVINALLAVNMLKPTTKGYIASADQSTLDFVLTSAKQIE